MESNGRGIFIMIGVGLLLLAVFYPHQVLFVLKFIWDLLVLNVQPLLDSLHKAISAK